MSASWHRNGTAWHCNGDVIAREMGYGRIKGKNGGKKATTGQILFIDSALSNETLAMELSRGPLFQATRNVVEPEGFSLVVSSVSGDKPVPPALQTPKMLSGVLLHGPYTPEFFNQHISGIPVVGMQYIDHRLPCCWVATDNITAMFMMVDYLRQKGHRQIAFLSNEINRFHSAQRCEGFRTAMSAAGLMLRPEWVLTWQRKFVNGVLPGEMELPDFTGELAPVFGNRRDAPTAVVCSGDWQALATIKSLSQMGLDVPKDVSVTGFGHGLMGRLANSGQKLTTLDDCLGEVAGACAKRLIEHIENKPKHLANILIRPILVEGQTVRSIGGE